MERRVICFSEIGIHGILSAVTVLWTIESAPHKFGYGKLTHYPRLKADRGTATSRLSRYSIREP